jgi:uncharacterized membrane protein YkoI
MKFIRVEPMIDKKILISIVIVLLIGVAAASYQISTKTPGVWQPSVLQAQTANDQGSTGDSSSSGQAQTGSQSSSSSTSSGQNGNGGDGVKSPDEIKKMMIQNNVIQDSTASAGTPVLTTLDGKQVYNVPILINNNQVGEVVVDAHTGKIIEGAGGAP